MYVVCCEHMARIGRRSFLKKGTALGVSVGISGLAGCTGGGGGNISLGAINPLSGPAAQFGEMGSEVQQAWAEQINDNGGIEVGGESREIEIVEYDDESSNSEARNAAERLATVDEVSAILSVWRSNGTIAVQDIVEENEVPTFTHGLTAEVNHPGAYIFRVQCSTYMDALPTAQYVSNSDDIENIAVIAEEGDWGDDVLDFMNWWFRESDHPGDYQELGRFPFAQQDFSSYITNIQNEYDQGNIDAVYIHTWATAMQQFLIQQDRQGLNDTMPILTGGGATEYINYEDVGEGLENLIGQLVYARMNYRDSSAIDLADSAVSMFDEYASFDGLPRHPTAYIVYSECKIIEEVLRNVGSAASGDIREGLVGNTFDTVVGPMEMTDSGQPTIESLLIRFGQNTEIGEVLGESTLAPITTLPPEQDL
jgi:branched-chain amino acid transport system substrate-binding protein